MVKTGFLIPDWLKFLAILLPLLPVFFIFYRKRWHQEIFQYLLLVCLFGCLGLLLFAIPGMSHEASVYIRTIFSLASFLLLLLLNRSFYSPGVLRKFCSFFLLAFLSVVFTAYALKGILYYARPIAIFEAVALIIISIVTLEQAIRQQFIFIFKFPIFWIASGTLAYYAIFLLLELATINYWNSDSPPYQDEKDLVIFLFDMGRYILYTIAAFSGTRKKGDWDVPSF